ncbi:MarR family transcriptional regulator [Acutalibacter muris]|uniref:MarR family transcriptional regulator n=1 Tax=Acutalibacter muris TaxID=1796620 RepID=UPI003FA4C017
MTFAQVFLLNEILAMEPPKIFSHELCKRVGLAKSSVSRTLKELKYLVHAGAGGRVHQTHDWRGVTRFQPLGPGTAEACPGLPCGAALLLWL